MSDYTEGKCTDCGRKIWIHLDVTIGDIKDDPSLERCSECEDGRNGEL